MAGGYSEVVKCVHDYVAAAYVELDLLCTPTIRDAKEEARKRRGEAQRVLIKNLAKYGVFLPNDFLTKVRAFVETSGKMRTTARQDDWQTGRMEVFLSEVANIEQQNVGVGRRPISRATKGRATGENCRKVRRIRRRQSAEYANSPLNPLVVQLLSGVIHVVVRANLC